MMDNEDRADLGESAILCAAKQTNVALVESRATALTDVLAYIAHYCDRLGLDPRKEFEYGLESYVGDMEDGPKAEVTLDPEDHMIEGDTGARELRGHGGDVEGWEARR